MSKLRWDKEGCDWPNRAHSQFIDAGGLKWHVQMAGSGPVLLLLHGTGSSAHSWRDMIAPLAKEYLVVAPDLPGHGFTTGSLQGRATCAGMAASLRLLLDQIKTTPAVLMGHSAGAAIALEIAAQADRPVIGFSPALMPFPGLASKLFPAMAKMMLANPFAPSIFARLAAGSGDMQAFLYRLTNSQIDSAGLQCYETLLSNSQHCVGALAMMANWDLVAIKNQLPTIKVPILLMHGTRDNAVPIASVRQASRLLSNCHLELWEGLGHLAHEEQPERAVRLVRDFIAEHLCPTRKGSDNG